MNRRNLTTIDRRNEKMIHLVVGADPDAERIPVYNQILRNASPIFKTLVESMEPAKTDLEILGVSKKIMSILVDYIYQTFEASEACLPLTEENVHEFFFVANKYDLDDVKTLCHGYLERVEIKEENCIPLFVKTSELTSANFKRKCLQFLLSSLPQLLTTRPFINLTLKHLTLIIHEGRAQEKCSEDVMCEAAISWLKYRTKERSPRTKELIDEFPCKEHRRMIIQALRETPDPEVQQLAFDLIMDLYTDESKPLIVTATKIASEAKTDHHQSTKTIHKSGQASSLDYNTTTYKTSSCNPVNNCEPAHIPPLKRPSSSALGYQQVPSCSEPKKNNTQTMSNNNDSDSSNSSLSLSLVPFTASGSNNSVVVASRSGRNVRCIPRNGEGCAIYFLAHYATSCHLLAFNLHNFEITPLTTTVPQGLASLRHSSLQYHRGRIYFMGGMTENSMSSNDVYIYEMENNFWRVIKMLESRYDFQSVRLNGWLFVIGGRQRNEIRQKGVCTFINSVEKMYLNYHQESDGMEHWVKVAESQIQSRNACALVAFNNKIYAIGGFTVLQQVSGRKDSGVCEIFDHQPPGKGEWIWLKAALSVPRYALVAVATENEIYAIGGRTQQMDRLRTVEILRKNSCVWECGPHLLVPRAYASGVYCKGQNAIFVFGGDYARNPTCEKLDLTTKTWSLVDDKSLPYENYYSVAFRASH